MKEVEIIDLSDETFLSQVSDDVVIMYVFLKTPLLAFY